MATDPDGEQALRLAVQQAYLEVGKGAIDRAIKRAEYVMTASTGVATAYTAILGLIYFTGAPNASGGAANSGNPLTIWALVPVILFGLAIGFGAYYVTPVTKQRSKTVDYYLPTITSNTPGPQEARMLTFLDWINEGIDVRSWALAVSVICLGVGIITLPLAFVT